MPPVALRFGTDVLVAPYRHPLVVAAMAGTLGRLAADRLILGVGIGYLRGEFEALGASYDDRAATTEEWVRAVRHPPAGYSVVAGASPVPIWIGGNTRKAQRRAALLGDGWHPLWLPSEDYAAARQRILEIRREHAIEGAFTFSFSARLHPVRRRAGRWVAAVARTRACRLGVPLRPVAVDGPRRAAAPSSGCPRI